MVSCHPCYTRKKTSRSGPASQPSEMSVNFRRLLGFFIERASYSIDEQKIVLLLHVANHCLLVSRFTTQSTQSTPSPLFIKQSISQSTNPLRVDKSNFAICCRGMCMYDRHRLPTLPTALHRSDGAASLREACVAIPMLFRHELHVQTLTWNWVRYRRRDVSGSSSHLAQADTLGRGMAGRVPVSGAHVCEARCLLMRMCMHQRDRAVVAGWSCVCVGDMPAALRDALV